jgi:MFS superfamily sulfate permease-like transporter
MKSRKFHPLQNLSSDLPASLVVFLVALPLCLGIALASGAPLFSGVIAGIVGGIVVGSFSGSSLSVSGPAAGLTTIVLSSINQLGSFDLFLAAVVIAGIFQIVLGYLRAGIIGNYFPSSVIKGMLAAIGLILILKQIPHAVGYDKDYAGDESFFQRDGENTFSELLTAFNYLNAGAATIAILSLAVLVLWDKGWIKKQKFLAMVPAPLLVVLLGVFVNQLFIAFLPGFEIGKEHLVSLPVSDNIGEFTSQFTLPDFFGAFSKPIIKDTLIVAFTIGIIASLESLLSLEAVDKLDPHKRNSPLNQELKAQGLGNILSGLIGGLPVTAVIVRSSANVHAGAKTKTSAILHGLFLLMTAMLIPALLNMIPLASLAAILLTVGYKLVKPSLVVSMYHKGWDQFIPFASTIVAILFTDLLIGIGIGIAVGLIFVLKTNFHKALFSVTENNNYLIRLNKDVSFLNKALLRSTFREIPDGSFVIIDGSRSAFIDQDILETINDFRESAANRRIEIELKQSIGASNPLFKS